MTTYTDQLTGIDVMTAESVISKVHLGRFDAQVVVFNMFDISVRFNVIASQLHLKRATPC